MNILRGLLCLGDQSEFNTLSGFKHATGRLRIALRKAKKCARYQNIQGTKLPTFEYDLRA